MADGDLGSARGKIILDTDLTGLETGEAAVDSFGKKVATTTANTTPLLKQTSTNALIAGGIIAAGFVAAVDAAQKFDFTMGAVQAVSGASGSEMAALSDKALQLGKDTQYSSDQIAGAFENLIKNGLSVTQVLNGAADATASLAAAGQIDIPAAADIVTESMNHFQLAASELPKVADLIAGTANASAIDVADFGESLKYAGATAYTAGLSLHDTAVAIGELGNYGIKGTSAGTQLKDMLLRLQPQTKEAADLMKQLGLITADGANQFYDATGKLKSYGDISQILQNALKGMSKEQETATLNTLFGMRALTAASIAATAGSAGYDKLSDAIGKTTAADVAAKRLDNLSGQVTILKGSVETAAVILGRNLEPTLQSMVETLTKAVNTFASLSAGTQQFILKAAGVAAVVLVTYGLVTKMALSFLELRKNILLATAATTIFGTEGAIMSTITKAMAVAQKIYNAALEANPIVKIIALVLLLLGAIITLSGGWGQVIALFKPAFDQIQSTLAKLMPLLAQVAQQVIGVLGGAMKQLAPIIVDLAKSLLPVVISVIQALIPIVGILAKAIGSILAAAFPVVISLIKTLVPIIGTIIKALLPVIPVVAQVVKVVGEALASALTALAPIISQVANLVVGILAQAFKIILPIITQLITAVLPILVTILKAVMPIVSLLGNLLSAILGPALKLLAPLFSALSPIISLLAAVLTPLIKLLSAVLTPVLNIIVDVLGFVADALDFVVTALVDWLTGTSSATDGAKSNFQGFADFFTGIWNGIVNFFKTIGDFFATVFKAIGDAIGAVVNFIVGYFKFWYSVVQTVVNAIIAFLQPLIDFFQAYVAPLIQAAIGLVVAIFNYLWSVVVFVWNAIVAAITAAVNWIIANVAAPIIAVITQIIGFFQSLLAAIAAVWNSIIAAIGAALAAIVNAIVSFLTPIVETVAGIFNRVRTAISTVLNDIFNFVSGIVKNVVSFISGAWNGLVSIVSGIFGKVYDSIKTPLNNALDFISGIKDKIVGFFADAGKWLADAGKNIINGLINGIKGALSGLTGLLKNITNLIPKSKGPEEVDKKLLEPAGGLIMKGLISGIQGEVGNLLGMLGGLNVSIPAALNTDILASVNGGQPGSTDASQRTLNYYAAANQSLNSEEDLQTAMTRSKVLVPGW